MFPYRTLYAKCICIVKHYAWYWMRQGFRKGEKEYCLNYSFLSVVIKFQLLMGGHSYGQEELRELGEKSEARDQRLSASFGVPTFYPSAQESLRPILTDLLYLGLFQENSHTISSGNMLQNFMRWCIHLLIQRKKKSVTLPKMSQT